MNDWYPLCVHRPPVQLSVASATPSHRRPPCLGSGAVHSLLRCLSHSGVHADHSPHSLQLPSTEEDTDGQMCYQTQVKDGYKVYIKPHFMDLYFSWRWWGPVPAEIGYCRQVNQLVTPSCSLKPPNNLMYMSLYREEVLRQTLIKGNYANSRLCVS